VSNKPTVWSSGGGVQSSAIAALICQGELPKPDLAVIADTGREYSPVWDYLGNIVKPALAEAEVTLHIASHDLATVDLWSGKSGDTLLIPAFTDKEGSPGKLPKYCSQEWKTRVIQRFCRQHGITDADLWIGFTIDEMERMRTYREGQPWQHVYPLIERRLTRGDCLAAIERMGWPPPPRSACWMCPFRSDREWLLMKRESPEDFQKAVELEREVRERDPNAYLHRSCKPIDEVEFDDQPDLFAKPCNSGGCFT
jgi:3'-phosphoadenosine 5'-phosphosulfate sulfotransferase (PAPS reductase)/FAD synthetase